MTELSDNQLVEEARQGSNAALSVLYYRHLHYLLDTSRTYTSGSYEPMDIVQETWIRIITNIHRFTPRSTFRAWAGTIARNLGRDIAVRSSRFEKFREQHLMDIVKESDDNNETYFDPQIRECAANLLDTLPSRQQMALRLHVAEGCSSITVAEKMGCSPSTVRTTCHFALLRLRAAFDISTGDS